MERVTVHTSSGADRGEKERTVHAVSEYTLKISPDQAKEVPMVDLAFEILKAANTPYYYRDLMKEIAKFKGLSEEQMMDVIAQVYTEINIDGRFACVGSNLWGLKRWYPVEKADDTGAGASKRPRIINDEDDEDEPLAEDKFHLNLPDDVDAYTGLKLDGDDPFSHSAKKSAKKPKASAKPSTTSGAAYEDSIARREENVDGQELPEDRFHKKDASSAYLINQREQAKKDKWAKHEQ